MRKKDEMEQNIANKSVKITWVITILALYSVGIIQSMQNPGERSVFSLIATLSVVLNLSLERFYLSRVNEDNSFKKTLISTLIIVIVLLFGLYWVSNL